MTDSCQKTPIGRPIGNTGVNLLDASERLDPIGVSGEFCIGGEDVAVGAAIGTVKEMRGALAAVKAGWRPVTGVMPASGIASDGLLALSGRDHAGCVISARVAGPYVYAAANACLEAVETPPSDVQTTEVSSEGRASSAVVAPAAVVGERLASICEELLGVTPVGVHNNLLGRGGHSLLATRLPVRIDSAIGARLPLRAVFSAPTIRLPGGLIGERLQLSAVAALGSARREFNL